MASISEIMYEERRNHDGSIFSRALNIRVVLAEGEGQFDISKPIPELLGLNVDHIVEFVHGKLDQGPCPDFTGADKIPPQDPPKPPTPMKPEAPKEVKCSVCGTVCVTQDNKTGPGTHMHCLKCKRNRQRDGKPFPDKGA